MHFLFIILGILAGLVALVLILALIAPKSYALERNILINRPVDQVFAYIALLRNQEAFNAWQRIDPNAKRTYTGTDGTVGFTMAWDSTNKQAGKGEQEITAITPGREVQYQLRFIAPFPGVAQAYIRTEDAGASTTKVSWGFSSRMSFPMNAMLLFMNMEKLLGKDLENSLAYLKEEMEK